MKIHLADQASTEALGASLWQVLPAKCLLFLLGDLGTGKTTLVRGMLRAAGYLGTVKSPTYSLVEEYEIAGRRLLHFDLYRIKDPEELEWMGMDDYLAQQAVCCVEWPQMGGDWLPAADVRVSLTVDAEQRLAQIEAQNPLLLNQIELNWKNKDLLL